MSNLNGKKIGDITIRDIVETCNGDNKQRDCKTCSLLGLCQYIEDVGMIPEAWLDMRTCDLN